MPLTLISGNRLEFLAEHLAASIGESPLPPLAQEIIIVQNPGIGQWLTGILAKRHGICANVRFPLPNLFIREILALIASKNPAQSGSSGFHQEELLWHIMGLLPDLSAQEIGRPLRAYLATENNRKTYHLARSLAAMFDRYTVFRPEMLLSWEQGKTLSKNPDELWQASLWVEISKRFSSQKPDNTHHATMLHACRKYLISEKHPPPGLPSRVALFAISSLPPAHLDILNVLAQHCEITFYLLNPCREYWEDIASDRDISRLRKKSSNKIPEAELFLERGNPILASLGRLNRDFLAACRAYDPAEEELFIQPVGHRLLDYIQLDILHLVDRSGLPNADVEAIGIRPDDDSIQIHACHSRLREVEVLHDHILHLLNDSPSLSARDIRVCTPNLAEYVPLIQAVFDSAATDTAIPYTIAASSLKKSSLIETFFAILDLIESRITAAQVLSILELAPIQKRFGFSENDLPQIRHMIENAGIRWGMDSEDRLHHGLPAFTENSWRAGLDRLILGYAMSGGHNVLFKEILPVNTGLGESSELLGNVLECLSVLFDCVQTMRPARPAPEWSKSLLATIDRCLDGDSEEDYLWLRRGINDLEQQCTQAAFTGTIDAAVIRDHLRLTLETDRRGSSGSGQLSGGVHFSGMTEIRSIPAQIICVLGMNDPEFPRPTQEANFDLMAAHPRPGDRSARLDDRALFLEILISARKQLYISYIGRSPIDDSRRPPSVLVSDLLDVINRGFRTDNGLADIMKQLRTEHHLQPFHHDYFQENAEEVMPSFSKENCHAALTLATDRKTPASFFNSPLPQPPDTLREIEIDDLCRFFVNPVRALCTTRLNIRIPSRPENLAEDEYFEIAGLDRYTLENEILDCLRDGREGRAGYTPELLYQAKKAAGDLPVGRVGKSLFKQTWTDIANLEKRLSSLAPGQSLPPQPLRLDLPPFTISGTIDNAHSQGLVQLRCATVKAKDRIRAWFLHLIHGVFCKISNEDPGKTMLQGKDKMFLFRPVENGEEKLMNLLSLYWQGMCSPLPFFAETSFTYAWNRFQNKSEDLSLNRAREIWFGSMHRMGECEDPYYRLCHRNRDPLNKEFMEMAESFYSPLLTHQEEIS